MNILKLITIIFFSIIATSSWQCHNTSGKNAPQDSLIVDIPENIPLIKKLQMLPSVKIEKIPYDEIQYNGAFKLMIKQPVDHNDPGKGFFWQKVYLTHLDEKRPVVLYLDGYSVKNSRFRSELADFLNANHIHVEHRFFGESVPDTINWEYLNIKQAAADHHRIVKLLKNIYKDKWISTGISKGGQTAMYHKRFYPGDIDVTVPVVAPLNFEVQDKRIYNFLDSTGSKECREKIKKTQLYILKNRDKTFPAFKDKVNRYKYHFTHNLDTIFELGVFEFEFAFWQWIADCDFLPDTFHSPKEAVDVVFSGDVIGFFEKKSIDGIFPFLYQSYTETGLYGYRTGMFKDYLKAYKSNVDNYETFIPKKFNLKFNPEPMKDIDRWLKENGNNMIYIYGEYDAWSSTAFVPGKNTNALKIVKKGGTHRTRISNLPDNQKQQVLDSLSKWLNITIEN